MFGINFIFKCRFITPEFLTGMEKEQNISKNLPQKKG